MEDVAFNEWPGTHLDSGSNSWLPAYGLRTPIGLLEKEDFLGNPDAEYFLQGTPSSYLYLETIHEETSDDLRSDSDVSDIRPSSPLHWLATDSETDSVICMEAITNNDTDCESERELACPIKRRRQNDLTDHEPYQSLSRTSSLLQFETLEKQCQENSSSTPSLYSQFSSDSLEHNNSAKNRILFTDSRLDTSKTWRSLDNLVKKKDVVSVENLSEDSGFGDQMRKNPSASFNAYDYCESFLSIGGSGGKFGASCQNLSVVVADSTTTTASWINIEKSECRDKYKCSSASEPDLVREYDSPVLSLSSVPKNLDLIGKEDELNAATIATKNCDLSEMSNFKREGSYEQAMRNRIDLSDDESGLCYKRQLPKTTIVEFDKKVLQAISESIHSINSASIADSNLNEIYGPPVMSRRNVASTPNLVMNPQEQDRYMDLLVEEQRRRSVQDLPRKSSLVNHSTSTSCMSDFEEKTLNYESGSTKGVHFSPVVSEVNATHSDDDSSTYSLSSSPDGDDLKAMTLALLDRQPPQNRPLPESRRPLYRPTSDAFPSYDEPPLAPTPYRPLSQPDLRRAPMRSSFSQSQPDVNKLKRRGSQMMKKDEDGCVIKAYVDGDGVQYKHTHLDVDEPSAIAGHVSARGSGSQHQRGYAPVAGMDAGQVQRGEAKQKKKLGGFFSRLASFRFSTKKKKADGGDKKQEYNLVQSQQRVATKDDYIFIPLKGPSSPPESKPAATNNNNTPSKPPLPRAPPRVISASVKPQRAAAASNHPESQRRRRTIDSTCGAGPMEPMGLIETDLDTQVTQVINANNVKTRSLMNLGVEPGLRLLHDVEGGEGAAEPKARPHKSMEFLLDKENLKVVEPPENDLQKTERVMSEHQLRVQRSLQKLTVPDWYKQSPVAREGFILKKNSNGREQRWPHPSSKTTSLSSLGCANPSPVLLSPSYHTQPFVRWSTSKLNSTASSPCASTRSSFNARHNGSISPSSVRSSFSCRQPYLGWRSQERLHKPRTPAERLANSLLNQNNNEEIQSSIKEVTSAIVHYVSGLKPDEEQKSRSTSPRGSQKLCWLESSFVGIRPLDSPQTPLTFSEATETPNLRLDLQTHNDLFLTPNPSKPSPGSTTLEDVLDSLLGLPSSERAPSPSLQVTASANTSPGSESRRFDAQCRYPRCARLIDSDVTNLKNCHNCAFAYCSRTCRRAHWEKHRKTCLFSRIGTLCRHIIAAIKAQTDTLYHLSVIARRGYLSHGSGAVKCFFSCPENAEKFLRFGFENLGELTFVRWLDLLPSEMGPQLYSELVAMCKSYNPENRLVLYVSVCVISETPTVGAAKWERQLVSRCAKMRLSKELNVPEKDSENPETLILTSRGHVAPELKQVSVDNVQRELRARGVSLRRQHPVIFKQLCAYADEPNDVFTPITVYPKDVNTGKSFMCIIMLEADSESLRQVESVGIKVRTVDVLND